MKENASQYNFLTTNNSVEIMKQSFDYWHKIYNNSLINYPLVWKKALESDAEILKRIQDLGKSSEQNMVLLIEQFFEMWSHAVRESNFEIAMKSIKWEKFWRNLTGEQFKICSEILQMIEKHWKSIQIKNIE